MTDCTPMDGEPSFTLLARDTFAPTLVRLWASQRRLEVRNGVRPVSDLDQIERAERTAERMEDWRRDADEACRKEPQLPLVAPQQVEAGDNGWIEWRGGHIPVPAEEIVEVRLRNKTTSIDKAIRFYWPHDHDEADIVRYRVVPPPGPSK